MTGSSFFSRASAVRLRPNWSRIWELPLSSAVVVADAEPVPAAAGVPDADSDLPCGPWYPESNWITCWRTRLKSAPNLTRT
ncbi:MAG: hypothetical protein R2705_23090 [Ilumatobacteraceae bacterium]